MLANLKKVLVIVGLTAVSGSAIAETATDTIEMHAGLVAAITFSCTDLYFRVRRVSPANIVADHHGGYVSEGVHTVTFNDTAGGDASL